MIPSSTTGKSREQLIWAICSSHVRDHAVMAAVSVIVQRRNHDHDRPLSTSVSSVACSTWPLVASPTWIVRRQLAGDLRTWSGRSQRSIITYLDFIDLSQAFPLTFWPSPVPLTRRPPSSRRLRRSAVPLTVYGSSSSTPCLRANFTRSACRLSEKTGSCHRRVMGCRWARKGFGYSRGGAVSSSTDGVESSVAPAGAGDGGFGPGPINGRITGGG